MQGFDPFVSGGITFHHIATCTLEILVCLFHLSVRLLQCQYKGLRVGNIEFVLSINIVAAFLQLLLLLELCGLVQQLLLSNYLIPLVINGIKVTSSKIYIKELALG